MKILILQKRKITLIVILLTIFFCLPVKGITNNLVPTTDLVEESSEAIEAEIYSAFEPLNSTIEMINQSDSVSEKQITKYFPETKLETKKEPFIWINLNSGHKAWILPSFYWGCFFGSVGVVVAGIISKWNNDCLTDSLAGALVNCNVVVDGVIIAYIYLLLKFLVEALQQMDFSGLNSGCNAW